MKKICFILLLIIIISFLILKDLDAQNNSWQTYIDPPGSFSLEYPVNWTYEKTTQQIIIFRPSEEQTEDTAFTVLYGYIPPNEFLTIEEIGEVFKKMYRESFPSLIEFEEEKKMVVGNSQAVMYHTILKNENKNLSRESFIVLSVNMGTIYIIMSYAPEKNFHLYKDLYMEMIGTFQGSVSIPTPGVTPTPIQTPVPNTIIEDSGHFQNLPEKIDGWKLYNEKDGLLSFQYPSQWKIEEYLTEEIKNIHISPFGFSEKEIIISCSRLLQEGDSTKTDENIMEEVAYQMESLGYYITDKTKETFCDLPAIIIKVKKGDSESTVITFRRGEYLIQIFCNHTSQEDMEFINTYQKILNSFRPFSISEEGWW